jgi:hypothetical protein
MLANSPRIMPCASTYGPDKPAVKEFRPKCLIMSDDISGRFASGLDRHGQEDYHDFDL